MYACQLLLAGSLRSGAGYEIANSLPSIAVLALSPWLHSYHLHLVENMVVFALLGLWAERRIDSLQFGLFVVVTGYITNLVPPLFGGGFGVGASGITNVLWTFFTATQLSALQYEMQQESLELQRAGIHLIFSFIGLIFVLRSIAEFGEFVSPPAGTATGSHLLGVVLGFGWFTYHNSN